MKTIVYQIPSINCMHCVHTIKTELSEIKGIKSVEGDAQTKKITVTYEDPATETEIESLLTEINYAPSK
jgi:copper chaperone CopZ